MFLLANFITAFATILAEVLRVYSWVVIIAVLIQWVRPDPFNPIVQVLRSVTEPAFDWIRRRVPFAVIGLLDLSPLLVLLMIQLIQLAVIPSLFDLAARWR